MVILAGTSNHLHLALIFSYILFIFLMLYSPSLVKNEGNKEELMDYNVFFLDRI